MANLFMAIGLAGTSAGDPPRARAWERRLAAPMLGLSMFAAIAFYLHSIAGDPFFVSHAMAVDLVLLAGFGGELVLMLALVEPRGRWIRRNWLSVAVVAMMSAGLVLQWGSLGVGMLRLLRLALLGVILMRSLRMMRGLSPRSTPMLLLWAMLTVAAFGLGLFWIDPAIRSAGDGLWLAFVSAATVGYGDIVPSTTAGRLFAVATILVGNGALSLITASLTAVFLNNEDRERQKEMHHEVLSLRHQQIEMQQLIKALLEARGVQAGTEHAHAPQADRPQPPPADRGAGPG
jgi:voltage-gated potassium channel